MHVQRRLGTRVSCLFSQPGEHPLLVRTTSKLPTPVELSKPIMVMLPSSGMMQISSVFLTVEWLVFTDLRIS